MKKKLTSLALAGAFLCCHFMGNVQAQESSGNKIHFINVQEGGSDAIILESNGHLPWWIQEKIMISQMEVILVTHGERVKHLISMF